METAGEMSRRKMIYVRWNVSERIYSATLVFKYNVMGHTIPFSATFTFASTKFWRQIHIY